MEEWIVRIVGRALTRDQRAFGDDQANISFGAAGIIVSHIVGGHTIGAEAPCHGGHDDAVFQFKRFDFERLEQGGS